MLNNENKNIFNDDDLLFESADSLFGQSVNKQNNKTNLKPKTKKTESKKENTTNSKISNNLKNNNILTQTEQSSTEKVEFDVEKNTNINNSVKINKKSRKKLSTLNLIIIIVLAVIIFAGAVTGLVLYLNKINTKLKTPDFLVVTRQNSTLIYISEIENSTSYEIDITPTNANSFSFKSSETEIELNSYLNQAGTFVIKVRALGKTQKATSDFSAEQTITNNVTLDAPYIFKDNNVLSWNPIKNADKYRLYYKENSDTGILNYVEVEQNDVLITFNLNNLNTYGVGLYPVCVEAVAKSGSFYLNSNTSNTIEYKVVEKLQCPINAIFNKTENKISFMVLKEKTLPTKFNVVFTLQDNSLQEFNLLTDEMDSSEETYNTQNVVKYTAFLDKLISNENVISVTIVAVGQGEFVNDSDCTQFSFSENS